MQLIAPIDTSIFKKLSTVLIENRTTDFATKKLHAQLDSAGAEVGYLLVEGKTTSPEYPPDLPLPDQRCYFSPVRDHILEGYRQDELLPIEVQRFQGSPNEGSLIPKYISLTPIPPSIFRQIKKVRLEGRSFSGRIFKNWYAVLQAVDDEGINYAPDGYFIEQVELIFWSAIEDPAVSPEGCFFSSYETEARKIYNSDSYVRFQITCPLFEATPDKSAVDELYGIGKLAPDAFKHRRANLDPE